MGQKLGKPISFRPLPLVEKRLTQAATIGFDVSGLINHVLSKHLFKTIKERAEKRAEAIKWLTEAMVPEAEEKIDG